MHISDVIKAFYAEEVNIADSLSHDFPFRSVLDYERITSNFSQYENLDAITDKIESIKKTKLYKEEEKNRQRVLNEEQKVISKLMNRFQQESSYGVSRDNFAWWRKELNKLEENYLKSDDYFMKKMGKRIAFRIKAAAYEGSMFQRTGRRVDKAIYCDKLLVHMFPEEPYWNYGLAETYAISNDAKNTRQNLELAVEKGFTNYQLIIKNSDFLKFKGNKKFDAFMASLKSN